jgi:peptidoglycan/xylan/chitin deacetylase (PgdA/CDA1 family)
MRLAAIASTLAILLCVAVFGAIFWQKSLLPAPTPAQAAAPTEGRAPGPVVTSMESEATAPAAAAGSSAAFAQASPAASPTAAAAPPLPSAMASSCSNPNALGVARVVEIDTTGGPGFGFEHFKSHDFLREGEVVLTFDDGPWPKNTPAVLAALQAHCTKAIFFPIGTHATYEPGILKQVAAAGHAVGSHTWCHQDLSKTKGKCLINGKVQAVDYDPKDEIEKGISAVRWAAGTPTAPYFRFPALRQPQELVDYLGKRNIAIFSTDMDSFDFKMRKPEQVRQSIMAKLKKHGKGIVLMHDFQHATAEAAMDLLNDLKAGGYKVVFMKPKFAVQTLPEYDDQVLKLVKGPGGGDARPTSSVVKTIAE